MTDPGETQNLAGDPAHATIVGDLSARIIAFFLERSKSQADMWSSGQPILNSMMEIYWRDI